MYCADSARSLSFRGSDIYGSPIVSAVFGLVGFRLVIELAPCLFWGNPLRCDVAVQTARGVYFCRCPRSCNSCPDVYFAKPVRAVMCLLCRQHAGSALEAPRCEMASPLCVVGAAVVAPIVPPRALFRVQLIRSCPRSQVPSCMI